MGLGIRLGSAALALGCGVGGVPQGHVAVDRLLVMAGQSNAAGLMIASNVTVYPGLTSAVATSTMFEHTAGSLADPPVFTDEGPRSMGPRLVDFGPYDIGTGGDELSMVRDLVTATGDRWHVAKMAVDASSAVTHWSNASFPTVAPSLLNRFLTFVSDRMTAHGITDSSRVSFLWIQGEADTGQAYATYLSALQTIFTAIRSAYPNCQIVIHRLPTAVDTTGNVRAAQSSIALSLANVGLIYIDDLALRDTVHLADDSYATAGVRGAVVLGNMVNGISPTTPYYAGAGPISSGDASSGVTPTMPLHQAGDWLYAVAFAIGQNNLTLTTANGFTEAVTPIHDAGNALNPRLQVWKCKATSSSMSSPVIADAASDDFKFAFIFVVRGGDATEAIEDADSSTATTSTSVSFPASDAAGANRQVVNIVAFNNDITGPRVSGWTNGALTDLTEHVDFSSTSSIGYSIGLVVGRKATAGSTGNTTATLAGTSPQALLTMVFK